MATVAMEEDMVMFDPSFFANTAEPGDIVLLGLLLALALVVGPTVFGIDLVVGRLRRRAGRPVPRE